MAINVRGPKTPKISVTQGDQGVAAIIVRTGGGSTGGSGLGSIPGVNVGNVQNNQTIFYNSTTGTFDARFVNLRYDSTDNYVESLFAGTGITIPNPSGHAQQPVISLTPSGVTAGTYGSNVSIPVIVVDTYGRVNTISNLAITSNILPLSSNTGIYFNKETGVFFLGQNVDTTSNVTFNDVNINNLSALNNITAQSVAANVWSGIYTANVVETSGNLYLTNARVRTTLSVNDQGGDGSLTYNNANGQFTYIGPSSAEVRAHLSSIDTGGDGSFNYDQANGIFTYTGPSPTEARAHLAGSNGVYYNNANGVFNIGQNVDTTSNVTFNDVTVSGKLYSNDITFNDITVSGNLTVVGTTTSINTEELNIADNKIVLNSDLFGSPSQSAGITINRGTQANVELLWNESLDVWTFTNDGGVYYLVPTSTTDLIEGTNLYYTNARARASVSINDQGGDGSITYNAANGQFTYIGPSPTEVRAHLNTSTGLFYNNANGVFHLRDTAVTPNVYGGSTKIPVITVDQQGRITNAANIDVAGVTNFTAVGNTFTIFTADGNTFSSSIQQDSIVLARDTTGPYVANLIASTGVSIFNLGDENSVPTISIGQNVYSSQEVVFANVAAHTFTGNLYGNNITTTNKISANSLSVTNDITAQAITANVWSGIYTANVVETSGNLYFTNARVRTSLSVNDQGGDGSFTYNNANGQFTYIGPSPTEVRAHLSSVDNGGDGSFSYDDTTGVFTYTGPSPTEVRAHLAGSNGVYYNNANGVFNIGQNVDVTSDVAFNNVIVNGTLFSNDITADTITVKGNLIVDGSTTTVNTEEINLADNKILLNSNHVGVPSQDGGIIINRGNQANVDFIWNETKDIWEFTNDGTTYWPVPTSTTDLKEGANLYYTTARVLTDTGPTFERANAALAMANLVYGSSNVKVGTVAGVNNTSISNVVLAAGVQQTGILNTSNVIEGSNLYYTTARVLVDTANVFNQANTARNLANAVYDHANLVYSSSNVKVGTVAGVNNTSISNVVLAAGIQQTGILNTSNVIEGSNLYYTTARVLVDTANAFNQANTARNLANAVYDHANLVYSSSNVKVGTVAGVNNTSISNVVLAAGVYETGIFNTSNVIEGSNLYYTTARVLVDTANAFNQANTARNLANAVYEHANLVYSSSNVKVGTVAGVNNTSISNVVLAAGVQQTGILNTSNVIEGSNLYYTTARVLVDTANVFDQANTARNLANAVYNSSNVKVGTVAGVNNTSISNVVLAAGIQQTGILNTSNVVEGSNLYFTTQRARDSITANSGAYYNSTTGTISIGQNVDPTSNVIFNNMILTGNLNVQGNGIIFSANTLTVQDPLIQLGYGNPGNSVDIGFVGHYNDGTERHTGLFRDATDGKYKFFTNLTLEPNGTFVDTANSTFQLATVVATTFEGNLIGNVTGRVSTLDNFTTSNVAEGANLYYTTARVLTDTGPTFERANAALAMANLVYGSSNVKVGTVAGVNNTSISNVVLAAGVQQTGILNTSNVIEGSNLYYTTARVLIDTANVFDQANTARNLANAIYDSSNVKVGTVAGVNATSISNVVLAAGIQQTGILNTSNVIEGSNLYYTTARVLVDTGPTFERANAALAMANLVYGSSNVKVGTVAGVNATSISNVVLAAGVQQTGILNTSNVIEGSNLYYTTARVLVDTANVFDQANTARNLANAVYEQANLVYSSSNVKVGTVAGVNNTSISNVVLAAGVQQTGIFNTSNVIEGANLYYTTARVLTDTGPTFERANAALAMANLVYGSSNVKVGTVAGVNATSISNVVLAAGVQQTGIFNTSNVIEGSNLYYTNARVRATIFANSGVYYNESTGTFGIGQNVDITSNVTFNDVNVNGRLYSDDITAANVTVQGNLTVTGTVTTVNTEEINLADNKILLNSNFSGTPTENGGFIINRGNLANTEFIWNEFNDRWEFTNDSAVYYPVATTTTDLQEGANLYYTNARARLAISANSNILYNSTTGTISLDSNVLTTANVVESSNRLYYTNARVITAVQETSLSNITVFGNVDAGNINITGRITGDGAGLSNVSVGALIGLTTQNVTEVVNLYFTNARSRAAISAGTGLVYNESTGVIRVDPNSQGGGGGGADFAASLIYSQP